MSAIVVTARLSADARMLVSTDGTAYVAVDMRMVGTGKEVRCMHRIGTGPACQHVAKVKALSLRRGAKVRVHAGGFEIDVSPVKHLVLVGVSLIENLGAVDLTQPREREEQAA